MPGTMSVEAVQTVFLSLLVCVAVFSGLARRLNIPYPIVLVVAGLLVSFIPGMPRIHLSPDLVFLVMLPPLLYSAAWTLSWREFQRNFGRIAMLAIGLVMFSVLGLAGAAGWLLPGFDWRSGFLLGAVVAATDAIAATSIARRVGLPSRIVDILEAESLVNDGTGLLAFQFGLMILMQGHSPGVVEGVGRLLFLMGAGVAVGLAIGMVVAWFERKVDDGAIEIVVSILVPYVAYLAGNAMHASGVLAVIACGMYMSRKSVEIFTPQVRLQTAAVWDALTFVLNGIVFVLIGLQLPYVMAEILIVKDGGMSRLRLVEYGVGFSLVMIVVRMLWVFGETYGAYAVRRWVSKQDAEKPEWRSIFVIGFTGMRGVLSLAAAFTLPFTLPSGEPFAQRSMIVFLTFCLIVATLVVQGLSLPWLIARLGLADPNRINVEEEEARRIMLREALVHLDRAKARQKRKVTAPNAGSAVFDEVAGLYQMRLDALPAHRQELPAGQIDPASRRSLMLEVLQVERNTLIRLRDEGEIDDEALRTLQRELDLAESRMHTGSSQSH
ncbi:Na+/H+ antiporter [soil metagenome]